MRTIRYWNLDLPDVLRVADGKAIGPWDENTASEPALTGMLLSHGAKRAQAMSTTRPLLASTRSQPAANSSHAPPTRRQSGARARAGTASPARRRHRPPATIGPAGNEPATSPR